MKKRILLVTLAVMMLATSCGKKNAASQNETAQTIQAEENKEGSDSADNKADSNKANSNKADNKDGNGTSANSSDEGEAGSAKQGENPENQDGLDPQGQPDEVSNSVNTPLPERIVIADSFENSADSIRSIEDYHDFQNEIGIRIRARLFPGESQLSIINENVASVKFSMQSSMGVNVDCRLRATLDPETANIMNGIDEEGLPEPSVFDYTMNDGNVIKLSTRYAKEDHCDIWSWQRDGIYYSLVSLDNADPMIIQDIIETCMQATKQKD